MICILCGKLAARRGAGLGMYNAKRSKRGECQTTQHPLPSSNGSFRQKCHIPYSCPLSLRNEVAAVFPVRDEISVHFPYPVVSFPCRERPPQNSFLRLMMRRDYLEYFLILLNISEN